MAMCYCHSRYEQCCNVCDVFNICMQAGQVFAFGELICENSQLLDSFYALRLVLRGKIGVVKECLVWCDCGGTHNNKLSFLHDMFRGARRFSQQVKRLPPAPRDSQERPRLLPPPCLSPKGGFPRPTKRYRSELRDMSVIQKVANRIQARRRAGSTNTSPAQTGNDDVSFSSVNRQDSSEFCLVDDQKETNRERSGSPDSFHHELNQVAEELFQDFDYESEQPRLKASGDHVSESTSKPWHQASKDVYEQQLELLQDQLMTAMMDKQALECKDTCCKLIVCVSFIEHVFVHTCS